jgi:peptidoglycan hydrolase FlgJ
MNVSAIGSQASVLAAASLADARAASSSLVSDTKTPTKINDPKAVKKAASQFEAIIIRQLLAPTIDPLMSGGMGGEKDSGGSVYGYMLTDALSDNMAKAGGLGLAKMLQKQLSPPAPKAGLNSSLAVNHQPLSATLP